MRGQTAYGKGPATRPRQVSRELWELNFALAQGEISRRTYDRLKSKLLCQNPN